MAHFSCVLQDLDLARNRINQSHVLFLSRVSLQLIQETKTTDEVLSAVTAFAVILSPAVLITYLFGMNVPVPFRGVEGLGCFFGIIGCITALCCMLTCVYCCCNKN